MKQMLFSLLLAIGLLTACTEAPDGVYKLEVPANGGTGVLIPEGDSVKFNASLKEINFDGDSVLTTTMAGTLHRENFEVVDGLVRIKDDNGAPLLRIRDNKTLVQEGEESRVYRLEGEPPFIRAYGIHLLLGIAVLIAVIAYLFYTSAVRKRKKNFEGSKETLPDKTQDPAQPATPHQADPAEEKESEIV
ncbi:MAG: hypothetical protein EOO13_05470 [Chitinophagaceae bacterium]|nr:MAG: hypothetical protein EOO13_05470 [Chitinophagaceae bacterium]